MEKISFSDFIHHDLSKELVLKDLSKSIQSQRIGQCLAINDKYGDGNVTILPLMADSSIVISQFEPSQNIEVYQKEMMQTGLSFTVNLSGMLNYIFEKKRLVFEQNQTSLQRSTQRVEYSATQFFSGQSYCQITLHLSHEWLSQRNEVLSLALLKHDFWSGTYFAGQLTEQAKIICLQLVNDQSLYNNFHLISAKALALWAYQLPIISELDLNQKNSKYSHKASDISCIRQAAIILEKNMQSPPNIKGLARIVGINDHKLKQGFKIIYQQPPFTYLRERRLLRARDLLKQGCSVGKTAETVGYKSASHFSLAFKKRFGYSPSSPS
jgi:AraC-like DNA-binding protein